MNISNPISVVLFFIFFVWVSAVNIFFDIPYQKKPSEFVNIEINQPTDLNYKTKDEIYRIRTKQVGQSVFAKRNYKPSDEVFGQIVDNKPWINMNLCKPDSSKAVDIIGPSEESRFINNPSLLVGINYPYHFENCDIEQMQTYKYPMPREIKYDKANKILSVTYKHMPTDIGNTFYVLDGLNARDLGYRYAYVDILRTNVFINFQDGNSIMKDAYKFLNYIHLGNSCGVLGGCNNGSPNQPELNFRYEFFKEEYNEEFDGPQIYIKLWKNKPLTVSQKADIVEIIYIDKKK